MAHRRLLNAFVTVAVVAGQALLAMPAAAKLDLYNPRKHYKDEKSAIADPASRCTGKDFEALLKSAQTQADKDLAAQADKDGNVRAEVADAYRGYEQGLALAWAAMQEPYCGFGAFGTTAAKNSLKKTLGRARADFLAAMKAAKPSSGAASVTLTSAKEAASLRPPLDAPAAQAEPRATEEPAPAPAEAKPTMATAPSTVPARALKRGDRGRDVEALQAILVRKGYLDSENATGYFGTMTEKALIAFQKARGLVSGARAAGAGMTGPRTRAALAR